MSDANPQPFGVNQQPKHSTNPTDPPTNQALQSSFDGSVPTGNDGLQQYTAGATAHIAHVIDVGNERRDMVNVVRNGGEDDGHAAGPEVVSPEVVGPEDSDLEEGEIKEDPEEANRRLNSTNHTRPVQNENGRGKPNLSKSVRSTPNGTSQQHLYGVGDALPEKMRVRPLGKVIRISTNRQTASLVDLNDAGDSSDDDDRFSSPSEEDSEEDSSEDSQSEEESDGDPELSNELVESADEEDENQDEVSDSDNEVDVTQESDTEKDDTDDSVDDLEPYDPEDTLEADSENKYEDGEMETASNAPSTTQKSGAEFVVIEWNQPKPPRLCVPLDTPVCNEDEIVVGRVNNVLGTLVKPIYIVEFDDGRQQMKQFDIDVGSQLFYVHLENSNVIDVDALRQLQNNEEADLEESGEEGEEENIANHEKKARNDGAKQKEKAVSFWDAEHMDADAERYRYNCKAKARKKKCKKRSIKWGHNVRSMEKKTEESDKRMRDKERLREYHRRKFPPAEYKEAYPHKKNEHSQKSNMPMPQTPAMSRRAPSSQFQDSGREFRPPSQASNPLGSGTLGPHSFSQNQPYGTSIARPQNTWAGGSFVGGSAINAPGVPFNGGGTPFIAGMGHFNNDKGHFSTGMGQFSTGMGQFNSGGPPFNATGGFNGRMGFNGSGGSFSGVATHGPGGSPQVVAGQPPLGSQQPSFSPGGYGPAQNQGGSWTGQGANVGGESNQAGYGRGITRGYDDGHGGRHGYEASRSTGGSDIYNQGQGYQARGNYSGGSQRYRNHSQYSGSRNQTNPGYQRHDQSRQSSGAYPHQHYGQNRQGPPHGPSYRNPRSGSGAKRNRGDDDGGSNLQY